MDSNILSQLRDLHEPLPPDSWPPTIGWWLALVLVIIVTSFGINWWRARRAKFLPYKIAIQEASELKNNLLNNHTNEKNYVNSINELLKRLVVHIEESEDAPRLHSDEWLHFLAKRFEEPRFTGPQGRALGPLRYSKETLDINKLPKLIHETLKNAYKTRPKNTVQSLVPKTENEY